MPNDAYTLSFLSFELNQTLKGGKINKINQPESDEILLNIYAQNTTHRLLISAGSPPRVHLTENIKENPIAVSSFMMSLRKNISGAEIIKISCVPYERIAIIELLSKSELKDSEIYYLYLELMGKYSNIILTNKDNKILSAIKTVSMDSGRPILPGIIYTFPPVKDNCGLNETKKIIEKLSENFEENPQDYLCKILRGISKSTAGEIIHLSNIENKVKLSKTDIENLVKAINELNSKNKNNESSPCLIYTGNSVDAFPFEYKSLNGKIENFKSLNSAFDALYCKKTNLNVPDEKTKQIRQIVKNNITKLNKKIILLKEKLIECSEKEKFKILGDLITSNLYKISKGDEILTCQNFFDENKEIKINLDKNLSPSKNAGIYYKKYNKLKTAQSYAGEQLKQAEELLEYFLSIEYALNNCTQNTEISEIAEELKKEGFLAENKTTKKPNNKEPSFKLISYKISGFTIYAGKNNLQNDYLTFKLAKSNDIWLHIKNNHGSHAVIFAENKTVPEEIIKAAAEIAGFYSKAKESPKVEIDYTLKKYVKKPSGAKPGFVTYTDYKTIAVNPKEHIDFKYSS